MAQSLAAFGLYPSSKALHFGAEALRAAKFRHTDISVMYSDGQKALRLRESLPSEADVADEGQPSSLAGLLTTLSGIGAVALSKDGPFMVGGPILATLVSAGESLLASLRGLGIPEREVEPFGERLRHGGLLLSVQCDDPSWMTRAREILEQTGAERVAIA
jgi:hypothetical protein